MAREKDCRVATTVARSTPPGVRYVVALARNAHTHVGTIARTDASRPARGLPGRVSAVEPRPGMRTRLAAPSTPQGEKHELRPRPSGDAAVIADVLNLRMIQKMIDERGFDLNRMQQADRFIQRVPFIAIALTRS